MAMTTKFQTKHACMLLTYSGISFISGAVNHGFFSGERSLWTAGLGILLFVSGALWEHHSRHTQDETLASLWQTLLWGTLLSIGLGFFTGGLQHFPDSPARSAWVVPVGFFVSVLALAGSAPLRWSRAAAIYTLVLGALVCGASALAAQWLQANAQWVAGAAGHAHGAPGDATLTVQTVSRSVTIEMDDHMRFSPETVQVQVGETIRFEVHNMGKIAHEFVLGTAQEISAHAAFMRQIAAGAIDARTHDHAAPGSAALHLEPGAIGELVVTFSQATTLQSACLVPGHLEAGMQGRVVVSPAPVSAKHTAGMPEHQH